MPESSRPKLAQGFRVTWTVFNGPYEHEQVREYLTLEAAMQYATVLLENKISVIITPFEGE